MICKQSIYLYYWLDGTFHIILYSCMRIISLQWDFVRYEIGAVPSIWKAKSHNSNYQNDRWLSRLKYLHYINFAPFELSLHWDLLGIQLVYHNIFFFFGNIMPDENVRSICWWLDSIFHILYLHVYENYFMMRLLFGIYVKFEQFYPYKNRD